MCELQEMHTKLYWVERYHLGDPVVNGIVILKSTLQK